MPVSARVAILPETSEELRVESVTLPDPGPHQVLVRLAASGICHSQLHQIHAARTGDVALGHEGVGTVLATGSRVDHVSAGDRVAVTWVVRNAESDRRPEASTALPQSGRVASAQDVFTWADHTLIDELYCLPVPDDVPRHSSAIVGCALMTGAGAVLNTAGVLAGQSVAVFGVGGVGICAINAARILGADPIIAVDLDREKLDFARRHGATHGIDASSEDPVARIRELTTDADALDLFGQPVAGADFAFDCIGAPQTARQILPAVRTKIPGREGTGKAVIVGIPRASLEMDPLDLVVHEKTLTGSLGGSCSPERDFPTFYDWCRSGALDLDAIVTRRFELDQVNEVVTLLAKGQIAGRAIFSFED